MKNKNNWKLYCDRLDCLAMLLFFSKSIYDSWFTYLEANIYSFKIDAIGQRTHGIWSDMQYYLKLQFVMIDTIERINQASQRSIFNAQSNKLLHASQNAPCHQPIIVYWVSIISGEAQRIGHVHRHIKHIDGH